MGFSKNVREDCLVQSARHCCVCHQYKGVKVEVHHITPLAQGGKDDAENAIALCFDCHADAGHYHAKHPKGTRMSPEELRKQKASWYKIVSEGKVAATPETSEAIVARHLVCSSWEIVTEIVHGDFSRFPVKSPLVYPNRAFKFLSQVVSQNGSEGRNANEYGEYFSSPEEIKAKYPACVLPESDRYPSFSWERELTSLDIERISDDITRSMFAAGTAPEKLGKALYSYGECGDPTYYELFHLRPVEVVFLSIENVSEKPLRVTGYDFRGLELSTYILSDFDTISTQNLNSEEMPAMSIKPGETILIFEGIIVGPLDLLRPDSNSSSHENLTSEKGQSFSRFIHSANSLGHHDILGAFSFPETVRLEVGGEKITSAIHPFDLSNYFLINRYWMCGSCPHIFLKQIEGSWRYIGEGLGEANDLSTSTHPISLPVSEIMISELEHEVTWLSSIRIIDRNQNVFDIANDITLIEGQSFTFSIGHDFEFPAMLQISGIYRPLGTTTRSAEAVFFRNDLVAGELVKLRSVDHDNQL